MDIYLYDVIGDEWYGDGAATAKGLRAELAKASGDEPITLRINSPGGDVMEAVTMAELLGEYGGKVTAKIDGLAASAASYLAATVGEVSIASGGLYMIHNPWSLCVGEAAEMRREADLLDKVRENLVAQYEQRSALSTDEVRNAMDAETWYTADEAMEAGLVDSVSESTAKAMRVSKRLGFKNLPKQLAKDPPKKRSARSRHAWENRLKLVAAELR